MREKQLSVHQLEVVLADAAIRAGPRIGHVFKARAWRDAVLRQAQRLVINETADNAHPGTVSGGRNEGIGHRDGCASEQVLIVPYPPGH